MNEDFIRKEMLLAAIKIENLKKRLSIATTGLELLISDGCDSFGIAKKTLEELDKLDLPQKNLSEEK